MTLQWICAGIVPFNPVQCFLFSLVAPSSPVMTPVRALSGSPLVGFLVPRLTERPLDLLEEGNLLSLRVRSERTSADDGCSGSGHGDQGPVCSICINAKLTEQDQCALDAPCVASRFLANTTHGVSVFLFSSCSTWLQYLDCGRSPTQKMPAFCDVRFEKKELFVSKKS